MRLLIVEDEPETANFLKKAFEREMFAVDVAPDGDKGSFAVRTNDYDLAILDHSLPGKEGLEVLSELRKAGKDLPVIMLTIHSSIAEKVGALDSGADDYLTKPFSFEELLARVRALLRRPGTISGDVIEAGDLRIDTKGQTVTRGGKAIKLTRKEFQLLEYLARNAGNVVSRGMMMDHVWDNESDPFSNTIETHILNLRHKIDSGKRRKMIQTLSGRGYRLDP